MVVIKITLPGTTNTPMIPFLLFLPAGIAVVRFLLVRCFCTPSSSFLLFPFPTPCASFTLFYLFFSSLKIMLHNSEFEPGYVDGMYNVSCFINTGKPYPTISPLPSPFPFFVVSPSFFSVFFFFLKLNQIFGVR